MKQTVKMEEWFRDNPYAWEKNTRREMLLAKLNDLTNLHRENCPQYRNILLALHADEKAGCLEDLPFIPVGLFKETLLSSIPEDEILKRMTSSGTTGAAVSQIVLDRYTSELQQKALAAIVSDFTGADRMPMIILDTPAVLKNQTQFSARGAGILGFSIFGSRRIYAFDEQMNLEVDRIREFLDKFAGSPILLFGFTFMIWKFWKQALEKADWRPDLSMGILIHGGGWKKLQNEAVSTEAFREGLKQICGIEKVYNYYGMVEQTGSIFMECEEGHLHVSQFSDILFRRSRDFSVCDVGEEGMVQVMSVLPHSYPGHSLLTEDAGVLLGEDDCPCGRNGKYFRITGRIRHAEIRGCSDTYEG